MLWINKYNRDPTNNKTAHITSKLPHYEVYLIKMTVLIRAVIKIMYIKLTNPTGLL